MQDTLQNLEAERKSPALAVLPLAAGAFVVLAMIAVAFYTVLRQPYAGPQAQAGSAVAPMTESERAYASSLRIEGVALSRASNFLHQEVTILNANVVNAGNKQVTAAAVTVEFSDGMNQVVLRETRGVLGTPPATLAPGETRAFEISFDHVPYSWNMQQPVVQVTQITLPR